MQEVILTREVDNLGDRGDIVRVAAGYARNYLYPKQLALPATAANKKQIEEMRAAAAKRAKRLTTEASDIAEQMEGLTLRIVERAGDANILFGSVTTRDIAAKLAEEGFEIDRHKIILDKPIKEVNDYQVRVHLYRDINVTVKVEVRAEGREDEPLVTPEEREEAERAEAEAFIARAEEAERQAQAEESASTEEPEEPSSDATDEAATEDAAASVEERIEQQEGRS